MAEKYRFCFFFCFFAVSASANSSSPNWGNSNVVTYPAHSETTPSQKVHPWGVTSEVSFPNDRPVENHSMNPVVGSNSVVSFSGKLGSTHESVVDPDYYMCGLNCLNHLSQEQMDEVLTNARPVIRKISDLLKARGNRVLTLSLLGEFCTSEEKLRSSDKSEAGCAERYFQVHRFWYESVKKAKFQ